MYIYRNPISLSADRVKQITKLVLKVFKSIPLTDPDSKVGRYNLRNCSIESLKSGHAIDVDGGTSCGNINGAALLKFMTRELYDLLQSVDPNYGKLINPNGTKYLVAHMNMYMEKRFCFRNGSGQGQDTNQLFSNRAWARSRRLTFDEFVEWRKTFKFYNY
jgi:hypothetical protein